MYFYTKFTPIYFILDKSFDMRLFQNIIYVDNLI